MKNFQWKRQTSLKRLRNFVRATWQPTCFPLQDTLLLHSSGKHAYNRQIRDTVSLNWRHSVMCLWFLTKVWFLRGLQWRMVRWSANSDCKQGGRHGSRLTWSLIPAFACGACRISGRNSNPVPPEKSYSSLTSPSLLFSINPQHSPSWEVDNLLTGQVIHPSFKEFHSSSSYSRKPTPGSYPEPI